ncbi:MAG: hypothetical protein J1F41_06475 [Lachnospiraceae bacterium]|nr:hypothetical protein [Lachnospiraceae bacterium]
MSRIDRKRISPDYLTDEALEKLISAVEAEPLLHPPKEFKQDLINQIRLKRKKSKEKQLLFYSIKVIAATAAALWLMIIMPENILPEDGRRPVLIQERQDETVDGQMQRLPDEDSFNNRLNNRLNTYCSQLNEGLNRLVRMEVFE